MGREGKLWQSRFYDEGIRDSEELQNKIEYIHNNPVRAGIVKTPGEYEFSSYNYYYDKENNYLVDIRSTKGGLLLLIIPLIHLN